jgi:hypothetical protein
MEALLKTTTRRPVALGLTRPLVDKPSEPVRIDDLDRALPSPDAHQCSLPVQLRSWPEYALDWSARQSQYPAGHSDLPDSRLERDLPDNPAAQLDRERGRMNGSDFWRRRYRPKPFSVAHQNLEWNHLGRGPRVSAPHRKQRCLFGPSVGKWPHGRGARPERPLDGRRARQPYLVFREQALRRRTSAPRSSSPSSPIQHPTPGPSRCRAKAPTIGTPANGRSRLAPWSQKF